MIKFLPPNMILSFDFKIGILSDEDYEDSIKKVKDKASIEKVVDYMVTSRPFFEGDDDRIGIAVTNTGRILCFEDSSVRRAIDIIRLLYAEEEPMTMKNFIDTDTANAIILKYGYIMALEGPGSVVLIEGEMDICPYKGKIHVGDSNEHGQRR